MKNLTTILLTCAITVTLLYSTTFNPPTYPPLQSEQREEPLVVVNNYKKQLECLAQNIYHEARSESYEGQLAVATVTVNRSEHKKFPDTICEVVWQRNKFGCQFSWTCDGKSDAIRNKEAYNYAYNLALNVLVFNKRSQHIDKDILFYHADYVTPDWENKWNAEQVAHIDTHKFFRVRYDN